MLYRTDGDLVKHTAEAVPANSSQPHDLSELDVSHVSSERVVLRLGVRGARRGAARNVSAGEANSRGATGPSARGNRRTDTSFGIPRFASDALRAARLVTRMGWRAAFGMNRSLDGNLRGQQTRKSKQMTLPKCSVSMDPHARHKAVSRQRLCLKEDVVAARGAARVPLLWSQQLVAERKMFKNEEPFETRKFLPFVSQLPSSSNLSSLWNGGCDPCATSRYASRHIPHPHLRMNPVNYSRTLQQASSCWHAVLLQV